MKYATMCPSCNRRFFIEFPYEYRCLICNAKAVKLKEKEKLNSATELNMQS